MSALSSEVEGLEDGIFLCIDEGRRPCMKLDPRFLFERTDEILQHLQSNFTPSGSGMFWFFDSENASHCYSDIPDVGKHYAFKRYAIDNNLTSPLLLQIDEVAVAPSN